MSAIAGSDLVGLTNALRSEFRTNRSNVPQALREIDGWLVWKITKIDASRQKFDKVPHYPIARGRRHGTNGGAADLAGLGTWEQALKAFEDDPGIAGVGLAMLPTFGLVALDADKCVRHESGSTAISNAVKDASAKTYSEFSPSGTGVRAFWLGHAQDGKNHSDGFELFHSKGFVTVTGETITGGEPTVLAPDMATHLNQLIAKTPRAEALVAPAAALPASLGRLVEGPLCEVRKALLVIPSDDRELWIRLGHALKTLGEPARQTWHDWSAKSSKYEFDDAERVWRSFQPTQTGYAAIVQEARTRGWVQGPFGAEVKSQNPNPIKLDLRSLPLTPPSVPFIIPGWLPAGVVTLFSAHGGTGKSYLALYIAVCITLGRDPFRVGETVPAQRCVLYSAEDGLIHLQGRLRRYLGFLGVSEADLDGKLMILDATGSDNVLFRGDKSGHSTTSRYDWLSNEVKEFEADLLIFDNASDALDGNENDRTAVRQFMSSLRNLAPTVLLLAHVDAATVAARPKEAKGYSGSTAWNNSARSRWFMTQDGEFTSLKQPKVNYARAGSEVVIQWDTDHSVFKVSSCYDEAPGGAAHRRYLLDLLAQALDDGVRISPHPTANNNLYAKIKKLDGFPRSLDSGAVHKEAGEWKAFGWVTTEEYTMANRTKGKCLALTQAGRTQLAMPMDGPIEIGSGSK